MACGSGGTGGDGPEECESQERFAPLPEESCGALNDPAEQHNRPRELLTALRLDAHSATPLFAVASEERGLLLLDASDAAAPVTLSAGAVRGEIHQLLLTASGRLWVAATEPPETEPCTEPQAGELEPSLRLIELDVSDPTAPVRVAETTLDGDFWQLVARGEDIWVATARRDPDIQPSCGIVTYEAVQLRGFRSSDAPEPVAIGGASLTSLGDAELPLAVRAWLTSSGLVTSDADGVHVLVLDAEGALSPAVSWQLLDGSARAEAATVRDGRLWVVAVQGEGALLLAHDLSTTPPALVESVTLDEPSEAPYTDRYLSVFLGSELWLNDVPPFSGTGLDLGDSGAQAQIWDLSVSPPTRVPLSTSPFDLLLPVEGATFAGELAGAQPIMGWRRQEVEFGFFSASLLARQEQNVEHVADVPGGNDWVEQAFRFAVPTGAELEAGALGAEIVFAGAGLPLLVQPAASAR